MGHCGWSEEHGSEARERVWSREGDARNSALDMTSGQLPTLGSCFGGLGKNRTSGAGTQ